MRRRDALRLGGLVGATALAGCAGGQDDADAYEPIGSVTVEGATEAVVGDDGETAYVAAIDGFATVDVTDPADPTVLAEVRDLPPGSDARMIDVLDVSVDGDRLAVAGPGNPRGDVFEGVALYDVSDPADPVPAADPIETGHHVHNCTLADGHLYVVANDRADNPLVIYDVTGDDPAEVGRWSLLEHDDAWADVNWYLRYLHDVTVRGDRAVLSNWNAGTYVLDVSDPADPSYRTHVRSENLSVDGQRAVTTADREAFDAAYFALPGNDHYGALDGSGDLLAVGREAWSEGSDAPGPGGIDLFDLSDPDAPERLATIDAPEADDTSRSGTWTTAHNFAFRDDRLFAAWYQAGVTVHDVADPADPTELAAWRDPEDTAFWTARPANEDAFVASSTGYLERYTGAAAEEALYAFPNRAGEQADPPPLDPEG